MKKYYLLTVFIALTIGSCEKEPIAAPKSALPQTITADSLCEQEADLWGLFYANEMAISKALKARERRTVPVPMRSTDPMYQK